MVTTSALLLACIGLVTLPGGRNGATSLAAVEIATVSPTPGTDPKEVPERYRLDRGPFEYRLEKKHEYPISGFDVYALTFPSPVQSPHVENNTVHAAYYRPRNIDKFPCIIVLDITGGDQIVSRTFSSALASNKIGALFVQMAYYGPRRPPGSKLRLLSYDINHTLKAVRQTVLDLRRATAWMKARPEIDSEQLGIMGTSLGGFMAALTAEMEPDLKNVAILLAGGGFVDGYWDHPKVKPYRAMWELVGGTRKQVEELIAPVDPLTCAANLKNRRVLMLSARRDEIVPTKMAEALWRASGQQRIIWFDTTHYGAALFVAPAVEHVVEHFRGR